MKRFIFTLLLTLSLLALIAGCEYVPEETEHIYKVFLNDEEYLVDYAKGTITHDGAVYEYTFDDDSYSITYPNGASYWMNSDGMFTNGGWSDNYDANTYVSGETLEEVITTAHHLRNSNRGSFKGNFLVGLLVIGIGVLTISFPKTHWFMSWGWRYKNAEPSNAALTMSVITGVIIIIAGVILLFTL